MPAIARMFDAVHARLPRRVSAAGAAPASAPAAGGGAASSVVTCRKISSRLMRIGRSSSRPQPLVTTARAMSRRMSVPRALSTSKPCDAAAMVRQRDARHAGNLPQHRLGLGAPRVDLHVHRLGPLQPRGQAFRRVDRDHAALVDDDDALAGLGDFRKDVGAEDDGVVAGEAADEVAGLDDLLRVEAGRRLVEDQHFRVVDERLRQADPLPVALRELAAVAVGHVVDVGALHHRRDALAPLLRRHALDAGDEVEVLAHRHVRVERRRFRQVAGAALGFDRVREDVEPGHRRLAFGRRHVAGQDPHRGGLAGAVRPEEAEDLAPLDTKTDVVHGRDPAVAFGDVLDLDHRSLQRSIIRAAGTTIRDGTSNAPITWSTAALTRKV